MLPFHSTLIMRIRTIFAVALLLRLAMFLFSRPWAADFPARLTISGDPFEYVVLGKSLLSRGEFSLTWPAAMPNVLRLPVYPLFVGLTSGGGQLSLLWVSVLFQVLIDSAFAAFLVKAIWDVFGSERLGLVSGMIYAVNPDAAFNSTQLFAESISVWLLVGAVWGLQTAARPSDSSSLRRFLAGVFCSASLILCKPVWQYVWLGLLIYLAVYCWKNRRSRRAAFLSIGWLIIVTPGLLWVKRNYDHWGVASLSYSKGYTERSIAQGVAEWGGAVDRIRVPTFNYELQLHCLVPDFSQPDFMPPPFKQVTSWNRQGVADEFRVSRELFVKATRELPGTYLKLHALSTAYTLLSPGTNFVARFYGAERNKAPAFANFGTSGLNTPQKFTSFLKQALSEPFPIMWTSWVLLFLAAFYFFSVAGMWSYFSEYRQNIWCIFLLAGGCLIFLMGPAGTSRYRFALLQAFLPICAMGILRWKNQRNRN